MPADAYWNVTKQSKYSNSLTTYLDNIQTAHRLDKTYDWFDSMKEGSCATSLQYESVSWHKHAALTKIKQSFDNLFHKNVESTIEDANHTHVYRINLDSDIHFLESFLHNFNSSWKSNNVFWMQKIVTNTISQKNWQDFTER